MSNNELFKREILIVDDDATFRGYVADLLRARGYQVESLESGQQAMACLASGSTPALVLLDVLLPGLSGLEVLAGLRKTNPSIPVIMLSGVGQTKTVVEAMRMGASDYLTKPFEEEELELAIDNVVEKRQLREEVRSLRRQLENGGESSEWLFASSKVAQVYEIARQVSATDVPVLITGESGTGKEVLARFIHTHSGRAGKPMVKVNCAALPHDLLESELFGYERGAFTGAMGEKPGKFELADKGSILLDEIGEMGSHLQAKLLHVLQDGEYSRLGGRRSLKVDARVLASTNRRLETAVSDGSFREDLYYRLNVISIEIPPLRERREDIPLLCNYFVQKYGDKYNSGVDQLPRDLLEAFLRYDWPGNVRQLENAVKRYLILPDLAMTLGLLKDSGSRAVVIPTVTQSLDLKATAAQAAEQAERELALRILEETNWNRKQAARQLGICYKALLNKLKKWKLDNRTRSAPPQAASPAKTDTVAV
jgi:two-component system response regulator AtoC